TCGAMVFPWRVCSPAAWKSLPRAAIQLNLHMTSLWAQSSLHRIIYFQAGPWDAIVPNLIRRMRPRILRGVHRPASSPGGIASQDRHPAVSDADDAGLPHLV